MCKKKRKVKVGRGKTIPAVEGVFVSKDREGNILLTDAISVTGRKYGEILIKSATITEIEWFSSTD